MKTINDKKLAPALPDFAEEPDVKPTSLGFKIAVVVLSIVLIGGFAVATVAARKRSDEVPQKRSAATILEASKTTIEEPRLPNVPDSEGFSSLENYGFPIHDEESSNSEVQDVD